jgi:hypothetical protein
MAENLLLRRCLPTDDLQTFLEIITANLGKTRLFSANLTLKISPLKDLLLLLISSIFSLGTRFFLENIDFKGF